MIYNTKNLKNAKFYYGTSRFYLQPATSHTLAIIKARNESKSGDSVGVYVEADNVPMQMLRAYKNATNEYTAKKINKSF